LFRKIAGTNSEETRMKELKKFREKHGRNHYADEIKYIWKNFDFFLWLDSKIEGKSFAEIIRVNAK
jgi:hypothetical protein